MKERISVVIPTYNREKYIERAVRSVLEQTFRPYEIIVVDDGSADNTKRVVEEIDDPIVKYVFQNNSGAGSARNNGVKLSTGDWVAFQDSDDVWTPEKLEKQYNYSKDHPEFDMIYSAFSLDNNVSRVEKYPIAEEGRILEGNICIPLIIQNSIGTPTIMVKRDSFEAVGGFDESIRCLEDWEFVVRFSQNHRIGYVDEVLVNTYRVDESVSSNLGEMFKVRCRIIVNNRNELLKEGKFNEAVLRMFQKAEQLDCLDQVKKLFMLYMQE